LGYLPEGKKLCKRHCPYRSGFPLSENLGKRLGTNDEKRKHLKEGVSVMQVCSQRQIDLQIDALYQKLLAMWTGNELYFRPEP